MTKHIFTFMESFDSIEREVNLSFCYLEETIGLQEREKKADIVQ